MINLCLKCIKTTWIYLQCVWSIHKKQRKIAKFMQTGSADFICRNELDKVCFQHDMAYGKSKDLPKRTQSDKVLRVKHLSSSMVSID